MIMSVDSPDQIVSFMTNTLTVFEFDPKLFNK
jgi:hypothetical protein